MTGSRGRATSGEVLTILRDGRPTTRSRLIEATGLSRNALESRIVALKDVGLVVDNAARESTGGRQSRTLRFAKESGLVLAASLEVSHAHVAVTDLSGRTIAESAEETGIDRGPEIVLERITSCLRKLIESTSLADAPIRGIGLGVPGPVEHATGMAISPPSMPGWDRFPIRHDLRRRFGGAPVIVDNDANMMAIGEYASRWSSETDSLLFVKVGAGIGGGIIQSGVLQRGETGGAGDLGHTLADAVSPVMCRCGNVGCLGAIAGGQAIAERLSAKGHVASDARDVAALVVAGHEQAIVEVREAGRHIGLALSSAVNLLNPGVLVLGGDLADAYDPLLAGVREVVYQRALPLATRQLKLVHSDLGHRAGTHGAAVAVLNHVLRADRIDELVAQRAGSAAQGVST